MRKLPQSLPLGRLSELLNEPDADLIAVQTPASLTGEYKIKAYTSRAAMEAFLKNPGRWNAIVKTPVAAQLLLHSAFQKRATL